MVGLVGRPIGHTRSDGSVHDLRDHLQGTADRSSAFAAKFDSAAIAQLIGLWHDLGKYHPAFQKKMAGALTSALNDEDTLAAAGANAKVDHSTAGALLCAQRLGGPAGLAAALSIASHHAGLPDPSPFKQRLQTRAALLPQTLPHVDAEVRDLDTAAARQLPSHVPAGDGLATEFWTRMLFSALVDADFLDTEGFMSPGQSAQRPTATDLERLRARLAAHVDALTQAAPPSHVNDARRDVLAQCRARAADAPGLFTLTVPTGGGKTLAAMNFALELDVAVLIEGRRREDTRRHELRARARRGGPHRGPPVISTCRLGARAARRARGGPHRGPPVISTCSSSAPCSFWPWRSSSRAAGDLNSGGTAEAATVTRGGPHRGPPVISTRCSSRTHGGHTVAVLIEGRR